MTSHCSSHLVFSFLQCKSWGQRMLVKRHFTALFNVTFCCCIRRENERISLRSEEPDRPLSMLAWTNELVILFSLTKRGYMSISGVLCWFPTYVRTCQIHPRIRSWINLHVAFLSLHRCFMKGTIFDGSGLIHLRVHIETRRVWRQKSAWDVR